MPLRASQNWIASRNVPFRVADQRRDQVRPPSVVRYTREESAMLIACAVVGDVAAMARRSSASAPGIVSRVQCAPPSVVCTTVPRWPLAHTTLGDTILSPRSSTSVGLACGCHWAAAGAERATVASAQASRIEKRMNTDRPG